MLLLTAEYEVTHALASDEGMLEATVVFAPNVAHESLMWNLANDMFGVGNWHVRASSLDRGVHFPDGGWGGPPALGAWRAKYMLARGPSRVEQREPRCDLR